MNNLLKTQALFNCENEYIAPLLTGYEFPWEILPNIKDYISKLLKTGIKGYTLFSDNVLIGENVKIYPTATIEGPAIIGEETEIRPGAFLRGSVLIGKGCVIGNSTELKNCVLLDGVQVPHYNYVGDSILGNRAHMGAGSICSNLKSGGSPVVIHSDNGIETGLRKIGGILADGADIGCGCVLNPGTVIGKNTTVYPLLALRGVYPENSIVKSLNNVVIKQQRQ